MTYHYSDFISRVFQIESNFAVSEKCPKPRWTQTTDLPPMYGGALPLSYRRGLVGWIVGCLLGWLVGWLVGCSVGWIVVWLFGRLDGWLAVR